MISDIFAWIFTLFVIDPLQAEAREQLNRLNAPTEIVQQTNQCFTTQFPRLIEKAENEPGWAIATSLKISTGWTSPDQLFEGADTSCDALRDLIVRQQLGEAES